MFWFHCGRCGSLFQARIGDLEDRLCTKCGFDPSFGIQAPAAPPVIGPVSPLPQAAIRGSKKPKSQYFMLKLGLAWVLVLALIVFVARWKWHSQARENQPLVIENPIASTTTEDIKLLRQIMPYCVRTFSGFLAAATPEQRNQYVLDPVATASRMALFYSLNSMSQPKVESLNMTARSVLRTPDGLAMEVLWTGKNDENYDCVFREQDGEWRLDWEHYARFADYPWALFLAGNGPSEGEFRLLARERLAKERKDAKSISLVLYAPRFGHPADARFQSPEFLVPRDSPDGRLIDAAFQQLRDGKRVYDSRLPNVDPEEMIRLRLSVRRIENNDERRFEIIRVAACHWYSSDHPGIEIPEETPESKATDSESASKTTISDGK